MALALSATGLAVVTGTSLAHSSHPPARTAQVDVAGRTTEQQSIQPGPPLDPSKPGFRTLTLGGGYERLERVIKPAAAVPLRSTRRSSLTYFTQLTDFQLADEESPARVEFTDSDPSGFAASAWRPQEALHPFEIDYSMRQLNRFVGASPHRQAGGERARMEFALITGDNSDSQQFNETLWVRQLIEGGQPMSPNSGISDYSRCSSADRAALGSKPTDEAQRYTGVQDYSDYGGSTDFYDPNQPTGSKYGQWPRYPNLMDRAQGAFVPEGLNVPTYLTNGNHDGLVQGNEDAIRAYEDVATGCFKPFASGVTSPALNPALLTSVTTGFAVPPDDGRRFVDRKELKQVYMGGTQADGHGFRFVDPGENTASNLSATYYAWDPKPGFRFIAIDTVADGGVVAETDRGNIDHPQFLWLENELRKASAEDKLVVVFGHHPVRSMSTSVRDEAASPCGGRYDAQGNYQGTGRDPHGHDTNPGCDLDPRSSEPLHLGQDFVRLLGRYPHAVAYVAGHTHENKLLPCGLATGCPDDDAWWEINTSAVADWPQQHRLVELMDNLDGTLSIFATLNDHAGRLDIPGSGADAAGFDGHTLAGLGLTFSYNDPSANKANASGPRAEGKPEDRNTELILKDPRRSSAGLARRLGRCGVPNARLRGRRLDRAHLGRTRRRIRRAYPRTSLRRRGRYIDRFCLVGGGEVRVGYPSRKLNSRLSRRQRRRVRGRAVVVLTSSKLFRARRLRPGQRARGLRRLLGRRAARGIRVGRNRWYVRRERRRALLFKVRGGRVREIGIASPTVTRTRRASVRLLRSYGR